ncbi:hypothetical protein ABMD20_05780 [Weissella confusa]|uniref:hypothetical protein n=1 Tax=Weissella confusa TaxID=1583 RepID=UPI00396F61AE
MMKHEDGVELYVVGARKQRQVAKHVEKFLQQHQLKYRVIRVREEFPMTFDEFCEILSWSKKATREKEILALSASEQQRLLFNNPNKVTGPIIVQWHDNEVVKAKFGSIDLEMFISKAERHRDLCCALGELQRADMQAYETTNHEKASVREQRCGW